MASTSSSSSSATTLLPSLLITPDMSRRSSHPDPSLVALEALLTRPDVSSTEITEALEEYAFRSMTEGKRVREWCYAVSQILDKHEATSNFQSILPSSPLQTLYPLLNSSQLSRNASTRYTATLCLLPPGELGSITRKQLIDLLTRLSREKLVQEGRLPGIREQILEVCMEYIARQWRNGMDYREGDLVENIGRKLAEAEFELQLQGHPETVRTVVLPVLHQVRFSLGLITTNHLVSKINSTCTIGGPLEAATLIPSWLTIRFRAASEPQALVAELVSASEKFTNGEDRQTLFNVIASFGLLVQGRLLSEDSILMNLDVTTTARAPSSDTLLPATPPPSKGKSFGVRAKGSIRKTIPLPSGNRWWSHKHNRNRSASSNVIDFNPERRPSLPSTTSSHCPLQMMKQSFPHTMNGTSSDSSGSSDSINTQRSAVTEEFTATTTSPSELLATIMTFNKSEDIRLILLDHLLGMRYRLTGGAKEDWCLGNGRNKADEIITFLESKLVGKKDVMGLKKDFNEIRVAFHLPASLLTLSIFRARHSKSRIEDRPAPIPTDRRSLIIESVAPVPPNRIQLGRKSFSIGDCSDSGQSFDLDQYIADISPIEVTEPSDSLNVEVDHGETTPSTSRPQSRGSCRQSCLSTFTIRQATREWPLESVATSVTFPRKVASMSNLAGQNHTRHHADGNARQSWCSSCQSDKTSIHTGLPDRLFPLRPSGERVQSREVSSPAPSTPTPVPQHASMPLSGVQLKGGLGGLPTPPASPPYITADPHTPLGKIQRQINRHWTIVDGHTLSTNHSPGALRDTPDDLLRTPRVNPQPLAQADWKQLPALPPANAMGSEMPSGTVLRSVMALFDTSGGSVQARESLTVKEVQSILAATVGPIFSTSEKQKSTWLLLEVRALLADERWDRLFDEYLGFIDGTPLKRLVRPVYHRSNTYPITRAPQPRPAASPSRTMDTPAWLRGSGRARESELDRAKSRYSDSSMMSRTSVNTFGTPSGLFME